MTSKLKVGDSFTISGVHPLIRNPSRRWWQVWKPRFVPTEELQRFTVHSVGSKCCEGGPQWGHAWNCPKAPD